MSQQYDQARQYAMAQLIDRLDSSLGLDVAVFGFDASDTVKNDLLPLHPALTLELIDKERNEKILLVVEKIFAEISQDIEKEYPETIDRLTKQNLGE